MHANLLFKTISFILSKQNFSWIWLQPLPTLHSATAFSTVPCLMPTNDTNRNDICDINVRIQANQINIAFANYLIRFEY